MERHLECSTARFPFPFRPPMLQYLGHLICHHSWVHCAQAEYTNLIKASLARYRPLPVDSWERSYALTSSVNKKDLDHPAWPAVSGS